MKILLVIIVIIIIVGCSGDLKNMSSGIIGCSSREMIISDVDSSWDTESWKVNCKEKTFYCFRTSFNKKVNCRKELE